VVVVTGTIEKMPKDSLDTRSDSEIVREILNTRPGEFRALFQRYYPMVCNIVWNFFRDEELTPDLCQEVFFRVFKGLPSLKDPSKFKAWLAQIARNVCINFSALNKQKEYREVSIVDDEEWTSHREGWPEIKHHSVEELLSELSAKDRLIVYLKYVEELSYLEISLITEDSEVIIRKRASRAMQFLRGKLG